MLLFGLFDFWRWYCSGPALKVQEISQKSTHPNCCRADHIDEMLIQHLTHQLFHKWYIECCNRVSFLIIWLYDGDTALDTALQVKQISQISTRPNCRRADHIDGRFWSNIQSTNFTTNSRQHAVIMLLFRFFVFLMVILLSTRRYK